MCYHRQVNCTNVTRPIRPSVLVEKLDEVCNKSFSRAEGICPLLRALVGETVGVP